MGLTASTSLASSQNKFSSELYQTIVGKNAKSNFVFSPVSIYLAMLMATSGSHGESLTELATGLGIEKIPATIEEWRHLVEPFTTTFYSNLNNSILNTANNVFVDHSATLDVKYKEHVNAVHFLGQWKQAFDKKNTYEATFYGADGESKCKLMNKSNSKEQYGTEGEYHWVTMPFSDTKYKMTIVAAKSPEYLRALDGWVSQKLSQGIDTAFPTAETELATFAFPSFELEQGMELSDILQDAPFNIKKPFNDKADFSNLIQKESICIDKVIHKAFIKVDEAGAEASAATAIVMRELSFNPNEIRFLVNTPFTFLLTDHSSKTVLFVGKVNKL